MGLKCSLLCKWTNDAPQLFTSSSLKVKPIKIFFLQKQLCLVNFSSTSIKKYTPFALQVTKTKASQRELTTA